MSTQPYPLAAQIQGAGPPLLCLHGHPGDGACLEVLTTALGDRFRTIAPDLRGYGRSRTREPFVMADHVQDLEALLAREGVGDYWILGWSLGGILALEMALRQGQRVRGLILIGTAACPRSDHPRTGWQDEVYTGLASVINLLLPGWRWNIETLGRRSLYRYLIQQHTPQTYRYLACYAFWAYVRTSPFAHRALGQALRQGYDRRGELAQIICPCWVAAGGADRHITPVSSQETAQLLPQAHWQLYPDVAHLFPWEIPDRVILDLRSWLDSVLPEAP
ncbi:MAG: alpha/beta hydrolase [Prochlorothrix sp.]|nr:alpha/beta hydrolase [Prochlorothrix sp.]